MTVISWLQDLSGCSTRKDNNNYYPSDYDQCLSNIIIIYIIIIIIIIQYGMIRIQFVQEFSIFFFCFFLIEIQIYSVNKDVVSLAWFLYQ